jgi:hypothetical protein
MRTASGGGAGWPIASGVALVVVLLWAAGVPRAQVFETSLKPDEDWENSFGASLALFDDTLAVGAPFDAASVPGSVHVFVRSTEGWSLQGELHQDDESYCAQLGQSLALDGEVLLVGAWGKSDGSWTQPGFLRGGAYVFRRTGGSWRQEAAFQPAEVLALDRFGASVALDGEVAVVGAPYADPLGSFSGRVWVFRHDGAAWAQEASLVAPDGSSGDRFGTSVAVRGSTLMVGAPRADGAAPEQGVVYVYEHDGSTWSMTQAFSDPLGARGDRFGATLSLLGDDVAVGAPRSGMAGLPNAGAVAMARRVGGTWSVDTRLLSPAPAALANLGTSVSLGPDVLIAGIPFDDEAAPKAGAALLFRRVGGAWQAGSKLVSPSSGAGEQCGGAVALHGDRAAVGARWRDLPPLFGDGGLDVWSGIVAEGAP